MTSKKGLKTSLILTILAIFSFSFLVAPISLAQASTSTVELNEFKDMAIKVDADNKEVVNKLQIFWHDLKDTLDLAFTFDKTKKIEKELKFAEKRIRWANALSTFDSQEKKDLAFELSAKADEYVSEIADNSGVLLSDLGDKEKNILENILIHQKNKAKVWENLESKIAVENSEDFTRIKDQIELKQQKFMERVANNNKISGDLQEGFKNQAEKIRQRRQNRKNFIKRNREQLNNLNESNNSDLEEFLEKRRQDMMHFNQEFQKEFEDVSPGNKQNRNKQAEERKQNHLQNTNSNNNNNNDNNKVNQEDVDDKSEVDVNSPVSQKFLELLDNSQAASDTMENNQ